MKKQAESKIDSLSASFLKLFKEMTGKDITLVDENGEAIEIDKTLVENNQEESRQENTLTMIHHKMIGTDNPNEEASISPLCLAIAKQNIRLVKDAISEATQELLNTSFKLGDQDLSPAFFAKLFTQNASHMHEHDIANEILDIVSYAIKNQNHRYA